MKAALLLMGSISFKKVLKKVLKQCFEKSFKNLLANDVCMSLVLAQTPMHLAGVSMMHTPVQPFDSQWLCEAIHVVSQSTTQTPVHELLSTLYNLL